ncbi:MAG: glycine oxidase ThiO [Gallionella sp.]
MNTDFLVVGGGVVGLTTAQTLLQSGYRVTLVERGYLGEEASWAGGGILSPLCPWDYQYSVTSLALLSMDMFSPAAAVLHSATGIDPEYQRCGMLVLPPYEQTNAERWCQQHKFPLNQVSPVEYLPHTNLDSEGFSDGLLLPTVAQVRNPRLMQALRAQVALLGCKILERHEVLEFEISGERVTGVQTNEGRLSADAFVVAAGAWSKNLLGEHAGAMDIRPIRGQILLYKFAAPPIRHIVLRGTLYIIPRLDGHVLVGSTLEDVGFDKSTTPEARERLLQQVWEIFPDWREHDPVRHWAGFRPGSPDNIPTIGQHPQLTNLFANSGHFRYGVTMSFASAAILLNEIESRPQPIAADAYSWR